MYHHQEEYQNYVNKMTEILKSFVYNLPKNKIDYVNFKDFKEYEKAIEFKRSRK